MIVTPEEFHAWLHQKRTAETKRVASILGAWIEAGLLEVKV